MLQVKRKSSSAWSDSTGFSDFGCSPKAENIAILVDGTLECVVDSQHAIVEREPAGGSDPALYEWMPWEGMQGDKSQCEAGACASELESSRLCPTVKLPCATPDSLLPHLN